MQHKLVWLTSAVSLFSFSLAQGDDLSQGLLACSAIEQTEGRLACYDDLADNAVAPSISSVDNWEISKDVNPVDDSQTVVLSTVSTEGSTTSMFGDSYSLVLRCRSREVESYINLNDYLGSDTTQVTYRIGTSPAKTDTWYLSTDSEGTFFSLNEQANRQFIDDLANADNGRLVAQVTPYNESPSTAIFNIAGLASIVDQIYEPCA